MFIGRHQQIQQLNQLRNKNMASLVCLMGRRRIGKSALIEKWGASFKNFVEIQGLGPGLHSSNQSQLDHFSNKLSLHTNKRKTVYADWADAFADLGSITSKGEYLVLLDEISWMGKQDPQFAEKLKDAWDTILKKNPKLIIVLCGSVSTWIEKNILQNTVFEGRISLAMNLEELSLSEINEFWEKKNIRMGSLEKILILSATGGVPKYLEEVLPSESAEQNIIRLCFTKNGFLFHEFEKIFHEIFERRSKSLEKIIRVCILNKLSPAEVAKKLGIVQNSELTELIHILEISGFLSRDYYFKPDGKVAKLSHLRVKDNYLRFYLKLIEPIKQHIEKGGKKITSIYDIKGFDSLMGLQFENIILKNREIVHKILGLHDSQIISSAPYAQKKTTLTKGACQVDLLIHTNLDVFYLCELKCKRIIDRSVIKDTKEKIDIIHIPKRAARKPILIYEGELHPSHREEMEDYFFRIIHFQDMLTY